MKRAMSLMLVTAVSGGASAVADDSKPEVVAFAPEVKKPAPPPPAPVQPRVLRTGAPACGNVMFKSYVPNRTCDVIDANVRDRLEKLDLKTTSLTVKSKRRPRL